MFTISTYKILNFNVYNLFKILTLKVYNLFKFNWYFSYFFFRIIKRKYIKYIQYFYVRCFKRALRMYIRMRIGSYSYSKLIYTMFMWRNNFLYHLLPFYLLLGYRKEAKGQIKKWVKYSDKEIKKMVVEIVNNQAKILILGWQRLCILCGRCTNIYLF